MRKKRCVEGNGMQTTEKLWEALNSDLVKKDREIKWEREKLFWERKENKKYKEREIVIRKEEREREAQIEN